MLPIPQKLKDLMHMDKPSITTSKALKTVLISTTVSLKQDFMLLKLSSTTLSKTLNSDNKLRELGIKPPPLNKLKLLERALILGEILMKLNNSTINLRRPDKLLSNTFKFPTFLLLGKTKSKEEHYYVQKGDSLYKIAKKYPGITISDIKKWNGISNENLKPGMKLKISG
jgi:membrane-bound lytic murein transglycosylase D